MAWSVLRLDAPPLLEGSIGPPYGHSMSLPDTSDSIKQRRSHERTRGIRPRYGSRYPIAFFHLEDRLRRGDGALGDLEPTIQKALERYNLGSVPGIKKQAGQALVD